MFCRGVRKELIGYIKDLLPHPLRKNVDKHLARCPKCRQELEEIKETLKIYHSAEEVEPSPGFDAALESRMKGRKARLRMAIQRREVRGYYFRLMWKGLGWTFATLVIGLIAVSVYISNMKPEPQETFLIAQPELIPDSQTSFRVFVRDHFSLLPVANAAVQIELVSKEDGKRRFVEEYRTNEQGAVDAPVKIPALPEGDYILRVKAKSKYGDDLLEKEITIKRSFRVLLTTDKPLYQPGQVVHIRALSLRKQDLQPMSGNEVIIEVEDSKGNKVFKETKVNSAYGIVSADFQLADEINLGEYRVRAIVGDTETEKTITVKKYVLPKYKIDISTNKEYYLAGAIINGNIKAEYFFGKPVAGARVSIKASTFLEKFNQFAEVKGATAQDGIFKFAIELPDYVTGQELNKGNAFVMLDVSVVDKADHEEKSSKSLVVAKDPINVEVLPESGTLAKGVENLIYIITSYPNGEPAQTKLTVRDETIETNSLGMAKIYLTPESEKVRLLILAEDRQGQKVLLTKELTTGIEEENFILRTDKATYFGGETVHLSILSAQDADIIFLDLVQAGQTVLTKTVEVRDGIGALDLDISPDIFGTLKLHAYKILKMGNTARDTKVIYVSQPRDLKITASLDKDTYRPGEKARINYSVHGHEGNPAPAALGISIVDESLFALAEKHPGLEKVFFTLEKEILTPMYEICTHGASAEELVEREASPEVNDLRLALFSVIEDKPGTIPLDDMVRRLEGEGYLGGGERILERLQDLKDNPELISQLATDERYAELLDMFKVKDPLPVKSGTFAKKLNEVKRFQRQYFDNLKSVLLWTGGILILTSISVLFIWLLIWSYHYQRPAMVLAVISLVTLVASIMVLTWGRWYWRTGPFLLLTAIGMLLASFIWMLIWSIRHHYYQGVIVPLSFLAIISVLAAMLLPACAKAREMARRSSLMSDLRQLGMAKLMWDTDHEGEISPLVEEERGRPAAPRIRRYFPETLFWQPELITDEKGQAQLEIDLADSITTWRMTTTAVSSAGSLGGITKGIRVFQDFFVDIDFPRTLTQNDEISVPVAIYNYLDSPQNVTIQVKEEPWFELLGEAEKEIDIASNEITVAYFPIRVLELGEKEFTVKAIGGEMSDAICRSVEVLPDGKEIRVALNNRLDGNVLQTIDIPMEVIDGASNILVKVYPGKFSQIVEGLDSMLRMPFGCFEQTSSITYPNVLALDYMKQANRITPEIEMKARSYINAGYQRLLSFEVAGGGFSLYGKAPAELWLTGYGLMEFNDMKKVYPIDENVISRTQKWLLEKQGSDGSWQTSHYTAHGLGGDAFRTTAYISWALAESEYRGKALNDALDFLARNIDQIREDSYTLGLTTNAFVSARPRDAFTRMLIDALAKKVIEAKDSAYLKSSGRTLSYGYGTTADIETTALTAQAFIKAKCHHRLAEKLLTYLIKSKDTYGSWHSTQATILSLKALMLSLGNLSEETRADIEISINGKTADTIKVTPADSDVVRLISLKEYVQEGKNRIGISFKGQGAMLYQIVASYYLPWKEEKEISPEMLSIDLNYDKTELRKDDTVTCNVRLTYNRPGSAKMVIVDLGIPPGFEVESGDLSQLVEKNIIEKFSITGRQIIIYLDGIEYNRPVEFSYRLKAKFPIRAKAPQSTIYEYYNPEVRDVASPVEIVVQ